MLLFQLSLLPSHPPPPPHAAARPEAHSWVQSYSRLWMLFFFPLFFVLGSSANARTVRSRRSLPIRWICRLLLFPFLPNVQVPQAICHRILPRRLRSTSRLSTPVYSSSNSPSGSRHMPNKSRLYAQNLKGFCLPFPTLKPFFGHTCGCLTFFGFQRPPSRGAHLALPKAQQRVLALNDLRSKQSTHTSRKSAQSSTN